MTWSSGKLSILLVAVAIGCADPPRERYAERLEASPPGARHAIHSDRLREVMHRLDRLADERLPREFDVEADSERRLREITLAARGIALSSERIPQVTWQVDLTEPDRVELYRLAAQLREQATSLAEGAADMTPAEREAAAADLEATCASCHRRFRIPRES